MSKAFVQLIDFHSHVLPAVDDGAESIEDSLEMMRLSREQGVCCMVATPHFYPNSDKPERFLARRTRALTELRAAAGSRMLVIPGAEVAYFDGISTSEEVRKLRIGRSRLLLVEMPFKKWGSTVISEIEELSSDQSVRVVIAHLERYSGYQDKGTLEHLRSCGVLIQANADYFTDTHTRRHALKMLDDGEIDFIGSDAHNTSDRKPNLGFAAEIITQSLGVNKLNGIQRRCASLILESSGTNHGVKA